MPEPPRAETAADAELMADAEKIRASVAQTSEPSKDPTPMPDLQDGANSQYAGKHPIPRYVGLAILLLFIASSVFVALWGAKERGELSALFQRVTSRSAPQVLFLESRNDKSLFLETDDERHRVLVQLPDRSGWFLVSRDDFTAANPALSPDGAWVAYLSTQNAPELVVVPLEQSGRVTYGSTDLQEWGRRRDITVTTVCPWTPIAWAEDSTRLAFFGCTADPLLSHAFVAELVTPTLALQPGLITGTLVVGDAPRQILWVGPDQVSVTCPPTDPIDAESVKTFSVR